MTDRGEAPKSADALGHHAPARIDVGRVAERVDIARERINPLVEHCHVAHQMALALHFEQQAKTFDAVGAGREEAF